ncbi:hypothetical protein [Blastopirellula marina]|uniref:Uncharacterized protein n=1 Tax=Blastopirellula marina DSM 3645 TaxID=314230 RepID=A4A0U2_9BACT|nr:hypothetical protein [Blastopirellula marina]EAQ77619.1 hypothetical protein DSM3645_24877 [Blastopirellula marina DSM 3645]
MEISKEDRFQEFLRRLADSSSASSHDEAFALLSNTLNKVEDELTDILSQPDRWQSDGRMYPPREDNARDVDGRCDVIRYRHKGHNTFVRENGAIEIQDLAGSLLFKKLGSDGRGVEL